MLFLQLMIYLRTGTFVPRAQIDALDDDPERNSELRFMAENGQQSFRHLFSFGGADVTPLPAPSAPTTAPESVQPARRKEQLRKRPHSDIQAKPAVADDDLSDPEDDEEDVLQCARNFCRSSERPAAVIRAEWFEGGRQERLRADFRQAHKRHTKSFKLISSRAGNQRRKPNAAAHD